ncbi:MAG: ABC transporter permease [Oscillospiraceae bacterium]|nr:ABC transporter permease [Oscillospiraceae bacterium]
MRYILKKTGVLLVTLLVISLLAFLAFQIIPGDPTARLLGTDYTPERAESLREELGLTGNVFVRYWKWLSGFVTGDMGTSYSYSMPVSEVINGKVAVTAALSLMAWLMVIGISIPLGVTLARYQGSRADRAFVAMNQVFMAIPPFFLGILFTYLFGLVLNLFVPGAFVSFSDSFWGCLGYLVFPALAIAIPKAAMVTKQLRSSIIAQMNQDYVRTAYSRGNSRRGVIRGHVLRNALLPVVTFLAMTLADIVAGSIIVEQVFALPGLGRLLLSSISNRDYPVVQCIVVLISFVVVFMNYLSDIVTQYIDPRVRLS